MRRPPKAERSGGGWTVSCGPSAATAAGSAGGPTRRSCRGGCSLGAHRSREEEHREEEAELGHRRTLLELEAPAEVDAEVADGGGRYVVDVVVRALHAQAIVQAPLDVRRAAPRSSPTPVATLARTSSVRRLPTMTCGSVLPGHGGVGAPEAEVVDDGERLLDRPVGAARPSRARRARARPELPAWSWSTSARVIPIVRRSTMSSCDSGGSLVMSRRR